MCGIAGVVDGEAGRAGARVRMLNDLQNHRGPDHVVWATVGSFTLGNTRLAIQDPSPAGNQPFVSADRRYHCVFNGEIYNHRRLVERYHLPVRTACDGEVIPQLWAKLGPTSLTELRGMFAIALVDSVEQCLYLARDAFGIKPLYWRLLSDGTLAFSSEVRPLVCIAPDVRIDGEAVARYLHLGAMAADQSPFQEITALPPNAVAAFDQDGKATVRQILPGGPLAAVETPGDLGAVLSDSIDLHLGADVPTALLLSAGVDSATIAAVGHRLGRRLNCLTVATKDGGDESDEAAATARQYGHHFQRVPAALDEGDVQRFFVAMQRPTIDGLNTYVVSKAVQTAGFKVALSGLGGDEAVGGYSHFRLLRYLAALRVMDTMPALVTNGAAKVLAWAGMGSEAKARILLGANGARDGWSLSLLRREILPRRLVADLTGIANWRTAADLAPGTTRAPRSFSSLAAAEVAIYLQATLLPDADAFSMASSVELRVPFVDTHVFAASLRLADGKATHPGKAAIGAVLDDPYLEKLAGRPKRGFSVPMQSWLTGPLAPVVRATEESDAAIWSVVDRSVAERAGMIPLRAQGRWAEKWALASLNAWLGTIGRPAK
jgi:asparagine synthase (glutamine-hydrolysing)